MNKFKFKTNEYGYYVGYGTDGAIDMNDEYNLSNLPTEYHIYNSEDNTWNLDLEKAKEDKTKEIRQCRSDCWQKFDGLMLSYERDLKLDQTNQDLINKVNACNDLRQSLKDVPDTALADLASATTLEEVEAVCFKNCLNIPPLLADEVAVYFA